MRCIRVSTLILITLSILTVTPSAHADPASSFKKLIQSVAATEKDGLPAIVLDEQEAKELVASVKAKYKKDGQEISDLQAAIFAGELAGMGGMAQKMTQAFSGGNNQKPKQPQAEQQPKQPQAEQLVLPSGIASYPAALLVKQLEINQFATEKDIQGKFVAVSDVIKSVSKEAYYPEADYKKPKGTFPTVKMGLFSGYLLDDNVDPALLAPGNFSDLYCKNIKKGSFHVQGECQVVAISRMVNGKQEYIYQNEGLRTLLVTPKK